MDAILGPLSYVFWVALALSILVFVHELGHFLLARLFGMRVDAFSIGFPPTLVKKKAGDTEYRLGAVPLGGYVSIAGMVDERMDTEGLESEPAPDEFRSKPVWQRMIVISAGVIFNLILAFLIYSGLAASYGRAYTPAENVRFEVAEGSVASELGMQTGDRVVAVNGTPVRSVEDILSPATLSGDTFQLTVLRDGREVELAPASGLMTRFAQAERAEDGGATPSPDVLFGASPILPPVLRSVVPGSPAAKAGLRGGDRILAMGGAPVPSWGQLVATVDGSEGRPLAVRWARPDSLVEASDPAPTDRRGAAAIYEAPIQPAAQGDRFVLGVELDDRALGVQYERYGLVESLGIGARQTWGITTMYFGFVGKLVTGRESFRENVGGPLIIAKQSKEAAERGGQSFWSFVAFLSIALAVFNVLPIPALDGGHLVFLAYEAVARREPSLKVRMVVQQVGLALILALMVFVLFNDAMRWFG